MNELQRGINKDPEMALDDDVLFTTAPAAPGEADGLPWLTVPGWKRAGPINRLMPALVVVSLIILSGCARDVPYPVVKSEAPRIKEAGYVRLEKLYRIDVTDISLFSKGETFKGFLAFDREENLYVADGYQGRIFVYDNRGTFKYSFGAHGEGPNDLSEMTRILIDGDTLRVFEGGNRIKDLTLDGKYISKGTYFVTNRLGVKNVGRDYFVMSARTDERFVDLDLIISHTGRDLSKGKDIIVYSHQGGLRGGYDFRYFDWLLINDQGELFFPENNMEAYSILKYDKEGKILKKIEREYGIRPYSKEAESRFNDVYKKDIADSLIRFPKNPPVIDMMFQDQRGNIWALVGETWEDNRNSDFENTVDLFSGDGEWLYSMRTKLISKDCIYDRGKIYRFTSADEGMSKQYIEVYGIRYGS